MNIFNTVSNLLSGEGNIPEISEMKNRRDFLTTAGLAAGSLMLPEEIRADSQRGERPNVLLIMTDDQGWGDIQSHGNSRIDTPVLDRLAESGARFDRFFVSPVCAPTRASLLSGRYHPRTGVHGVTRGFETMRSEEVTLAEILKQAGYVTGCFGKWHNGAHYPSHPNGQGFDEFFGFCAGHWNNYFDTTLEHNGLPVKTKGYIADVLTDAAVNFIDKNKDRPFFCYVPYNPPHSPFQVPDGYFRQYKLQGMDDKLACVYAMCTNLDYNIGRIFNKLRELGPGKETIVIFLTDNGPNTARFNGDMRGRKGSVHEGGGRVPCFIHWPGQIEPGRTIRQIAAHIDILPTVVELTKVKVPATKPLDGVSLVPLLKGDSPGWPDRMLFTKWADRGAVRTQDFRLVIENNRPQLYDMNSDPGEKKDLARSRPEVTKKLKTAYDDWLREVSADGFDPIPIPIGYLQRKEVELPGHEAFLEPEAGSGISYNGRSGWANDWVTNWTSVEAYPYWEIDVVHAGYYEITLMYVCGEQNIGTRLSVEAGGRRIEGVIEKAHNPPPVPSPDRVQRIEVYEKEWMPLQIGSMPLKRGRTRLTVKALTKPGSMVIDLKSVRVKRLD